LLAFVIFAVCAAVVFWYSLVYTVHRGTLAVPSFEGLTVSEGHQIAHDVGLVLEVDDRGVFSTEVQPGDIAAQDPHPGFHLKTGSSVRVRVSLGGERVSIPPVRGESLQGALRGLEHLGLDSGRRAQVMGQGPGDRVLATDPPVGAEVAPDSEVSLLVNVTPRQELWIMPSFLTRSLEFVRGFCRRNHLRLGQVHEVAYPGLTRATVLRQYPPAGSPVGRSDIITLWVSQ
jgi:serine/threonine-protein kinase